MHSTVVRGQNVFGLFTTVAFFVGALIACSVLFFPQHPSADISLRSIQVVKGRPHYYSSKKEEYAHIKFDIDADLSSLFNWNTKQVFVNVIAKWPTPNNPSQFSEAIIWDQIIPANPALNPNIAAERRRGKVGTVAPTKAERGKFKIRNVKSKYQITDITGKMAERGNATLEVGWNVQPWVGALTWRTQSKLGLWEPMKGGRSKAFNFPQLKGKKEAGAGST